jgi:hypothetical protein
MFTADVFVSKLCCELRRVCFQMDSIRNLETRIFPPATRLEKEGSSHNRQTYKPNQGRQYFLF